jgi:hypothetical protein
MFITHIIIKSYDPVGVAYNQPHVFYRHLIPSGLLQITIGTYLNPKDSNVYNKNRNIKIRPLRGHI